MYTWENLFHWHSLLSNKRISNLLVGRQSSVSLAITNLHCKLSRMQLSLKIRVMPFCSLLLPCIQIWLHWIQPIKDQKTFNLTVSCSMKEFLVLLKLCSFFSVEYPLSPARLMSTTCNTKSVFTTTGRTAIAGHWATQIPAALKPNNCQNY